MRGRSHLCLGQYLIDHYINDALPLHRKAFLFGCIQPDRNPLTYLKGSLRCQWFRGHNYRNAQRFMRRISLRLERRSTLNTLDFYTLGKLIHYTADAFTYAHNEGFPESLADHREYEAVLQNRFLSYLQQNPEVNICLTRTIMEGIIHYRSEYAAMCRNVDTDCMYTLHACCSVLTVLLSRCIL